MGIPLPSRVLSHAAEGIHLGGYAAHQWMHFELPGPLAAWVTGAVAIIMAKYVICVIWPMSCKYCGQTLIWCGNKLLVAQKLPEGIARCGKYVRMKVANGLQAIADALKSIK